MHGDTSRGACCPNAIGYALEEMWQETVNGLLDDDYEDDDGGNHEDDGKNEGKGVAAVHCIILGYGKQPAAQPVVFDYSSNIKAAEGTVILVSRINPYLVDAPDLLISRRSSPLCDVPEMCFGNQPIDGGHLILEPQEAVDLKSRYPDLAPFVRLFVGAEEFLNGGERYCLWLKSASSSLLRNIPEVKERVAKVKEFRLSSKRKATNDLAATPSQFAFVSHKESTYLLIPLHTSENRRFIPIGYLDPSIICSNANSMLPNATLYHFGMLSSTMHNAWVRTVAGRLESRYRYSNTIVYNNYPWPQEASDKQRLAVEAAAQAVLDARDLEFARCAKAGQHCSLALLYNPDTMPAELVQAHAQLDRAVDAAYGYKGSKDDAARVAYLFARYSQLVAPLDAQPSPKKARAKKAA